MSRLIDWLRQVTVYGLTYLLGFLGALTLVAILTRLESTAWMPAALGVIFFLLLGVLPPFKNFVLRLATMGLFTSGCLSLWFISEPPPASEPNARFNSLVPIIGSVGPLMCALVILLLWEERRDVSHWVWRWILALCASAWVCCYFSTYHSFSGTHTLLHENFRYTSEIALTHRLPHRGLLQIGFFGLVTVMSVAAATASQAKLRDRAIFGFVFPAILALFDEGRFRLEFVEHLSKRSLAVDFGTILVALVVALAATAAFGKPAPSRNPTAANG